MKRMNSMVFAKREEAFQWTTQFLNPCLMCKVPRSLTSKVSCNEKDLRSNLDFKFSSMTRRKKISFRVEFEKY